MASPEDVDLRFREAFEDGRLNEVRELIKSYGLSYSPEWEEGYRLLCEALNCKQTDIAKLLLNSGCRVVSAVQPFRYSTPLHLVIQKGDFEVIKMILDRSVDVINERDKNGYAPLHYAIYAKNLDVIELILRHGANVEAEFPNGESPLFTAVKLHNIKIVESLLKESACINSVCTSEMRGKYAPLHETVFQNDEQMVTFLLSKGADVDVRGQDSKTPLHIATQNGYVNILKQLLDNGANINSTYTSDDEEGVTALHFASKSKDFFLTREETVELLLKRGADVNVKDSSHFTPLHLAFKNGHTSIVERLLQNGAKVDELDKDEKTALYWAVRTRDPKIVKEVLKYCPDKDNRSNRSSFKLAVLNDCGHIIDPLLKYGFKIDPKEEQEKDLGRLFHRFVQRGCLKIVEEFLNFGIDVNILDDFYLTFTPLHSAVRGKQTEAAELLISRGADVNANDESGNTPIIHAIQRNDIEMIKLLLKYNAYINPQLLNKLAEEGRKEIIEVLLKHGLDINTRDEFGKTALHFAAQNGHKEIIELLLNFGADINSTNNDGQTALHIAYRHNRGKVLETLLEYGADINNSTNRNDKRYEPREFMDEFVNPSPYISYSDFVLNNHLVKMRVANFYLNVENSRILRDLQKMERMEGQNKLKNYKRKCRDELNRMKNEKVPNSNISFYDVLMKSTQTVASYTRNESIVQLLSSDLKAFPIYSVLIKGQIRKGIKRKESLEQNYKVINFFFNHSLGLPFFCSELILSYFNNVEFKTLIDTLKVIHAQNSNRAQKRRIR